MNRRSGRRNAGGGKTFGRVAVLVAVALGVASGVGALIVLLLRRNDAAEPVPADTAPEPAESGVEEVVVIPASEPRREPADYSLDQPLDQEETAVEDPGEDLAQGSAQERERTVREFVNRLNEEPPAGRRAEAQPGEAGLGEAGSGEAGEEPAGIAEEPAPEAGETAQEVPEGTADHADAERQDDRVTVVGVLARMGEAYREAGGSRFVLSSEDEGNFDLYGREEDLDEVYERQVSARVMGRILDEDSQPRTFEVDEVEPA